MYYPPDYCESTFDPTGYGFHFSAPPPSDLGDRQNLRASNPWIVLSCALLRLRQGDFSVFPALIDSWLQQDDLLVALDVGILFAHAAPPSSMGLLRRVYTDELLGEHPELVRQYCEILCGTLMPAYLDTVLGWYATTHDDSVRYEVPWDLSNVWEDEPGVIHQGAKAVPDPQYPPPFEQFYIDYKSYEQRVHEVAARVDSSTRYVLGGAPFSVLRLAERILAHAHAGEDSPRTSFERMVFEANTGISCRDFYTDEDVPKFRPLEAIAVVEDFLDNPRSRHFVDGQRYFWGHPIPY